MIARIEKAYRELGDWIQAAVADGWLTPADREALERIELASAEDLFEHSDGRPLVVGFFGGTGVGKSSLLNRLAGEQIAQVGVERPTSRGVTLYLHASHDLASLPKEFPVQRTHIAAHSDASRKNLVWIDMPDIDSTERSNRELVFAWLPYIDWLIYVVSPERYRDDAGWTVLRDRGHRHHWLFVMNQRDLGRAEQIEDFVNDLQHAGFDRPTVISTSCVTDAAEDEFDRLERTIHDAIEVHGLAELQRLGIRARLDDLAQLAATLSARFGDDEGWKRCIDGHRAHTATLLEKLEDHLQWPIETVANRFRGNNGRWSLMRSRDAEHRIDLPALREQLWSEQAQIVLDDIVHRGVVDAEVNGIAAGALQRALRSSLENAEKDMVTAAFEQLDKALAKPGNALQRISRTAARVLCYLLPLGSALWVVYNVVWKYRLALAGEAEFFGVDFTVHSLLLIFLSWLVPYLLFRVLKPSLRSSARRGLRSGVAAGIKSISADMERAYSGLSAERTRRLRALRALDLRRPS